LLEHPTISGQHAVIQFREISKTVKFTLVKSIKPYIIDLESTNKTFLNDEALEPARYYELLEKDVL